MHSLPLRTLSPLVVIEPGPQTDKCSFYLPGCLSDQLQSLLCRRDHSLTHNRIHHRSHHKLTCFQLQVSAMATTQHTPTRIRRDTCPLSPHHSSPLFLNNATGTHTELQILCPGGHHKCYPMNHIQRNQRLTRPRCSQGPCRPIFCAVDAHRQHSYPQTISGRHSIPCLPSDCA